MVPKVRFWNVAVAPTFSRFMLAVNGFESVNVTLAIPVFTIFVGNVREVEVIKFWCKAGIITGLS